MLSVGEARHAIREALSPLPEETVTLAEARGRVLRQPVAAERDQPPYDRVTMDGIAVRHAVLAGGTRRFRIAGTQYAGEPARELGHDGDCIEVMTGAVLPAGSDCIIPVERLQKGDSHLVVDADYGAEVGQFVHRRGSDHRAGHTLLAAGRRISALDIALLASAGLPEVRVARLPRVRVLSTGNELVPAGAAIEPHQVRLSNGPALVAMLDGQGFTDSRHTHLADEPDTMRRVIADLLDECDVLLLSGGVSMGKADFVPQVLDEIGVRRVFHKIAQRPGKPMWFGIGPRGQAVFALPGNPVSALTCCRHYVLPALHEASGGEPGEPLRVALGADFDFRPALTCLLPVTLGDDADGRRIATPVLTNTSGDFTALARSDGYLELPAGQSHFDAGSTWPLFRWDAI